MPRGVALDFLRVLDADVRAARTRFWGAIGLAVLLAGLAWWLDGLRGLIAHAIALVVGVGVGLLVVHLSTQRYEAGLRSRWREWMRLARAAESVPEIHHRARGRGLRNRVFLIAAGLAAAWALELLLFALALADETALWWSIVVIALNGIVAGALAAAALRMRSWSRDLRGSIQALVDEGEIGTWGVME